MIFRVLGRQSQTKIVLFSRSLQKTRGLERGDVLVLDDGDLRRLVSDDNLGAVAMMLIDVDNELGLVESVWQIEFSRARQHAFHVTIRNKHYITSSFFSF